MAFTAEQKAALEGKLNPAHVKSRSQAGRQLSYIEGWWAISEANRIFGFDGWNRETAELRQLGDSREVDGKWRVAYMARVRVTVGSDYLIRDGCGYGSGIDRDLGSAHESAIKEAETDAMKRALMTFGNPFGLALYDKTQENVGVEAPPSRLPPKRSQAEISAHTAWKNKTLEEIQDDLTKIESRAELESYKRKELTPDKMLRLGQKQFVIENEVAKLEDHFGPLPDEPEPEDTTILETLKMAAAQAKSRKALEDWQAGQHKAIKELSPGQLAEFRAYYKKLLMGFPRSDKPYNPANRADALDNWAAPS